jgi:pimeloyl-ACP methyl ester carboxylesterase
MDVELVSVETADHLRLSGALRRPQREASTQLGADAVVFHHGVGGNFYNPSFVDTIGSAFLAEGCAVLRVNNRGHDLAFNSTGRKLGAAYETVDDCRLDWRAWIDFCQQRGYQRVALWGHSLGAVKTIYYLATERDPRVLWAVASSPPRLAFQTRGAGDEGAPLVADYERARSLVDSGAGETVFALSDQTALALGTARTFIDKYGPEDRYDILKHLPNVPAPILVTVGSLEQQLSFRAHRTELPALAAGVPNLKFALVDGADHQYTGVVDSLQKAALSFIRAATAPAAAAV